MSLQPPHTLFPLSTHTHTHTHTSYITLLRVRKAPSDDASVLFPTLTPFGFVFLGPSYMHTQRGSYTHPFFISFFSFPFFLSRLFIPRNPPPRFLTPPPSTRYVSFGLVGLTISQKRRQPSNETGLVLFVVFLSS
jgi:hypothetical protein